MNVRVGPYHFDSVAYDDDRDVMNLAVNGSSGAAEETPEHHFWFWDGERLAGLVLQDVRDQMTREGGIFVTLPSGERVRATDAEAFLQ